MILTQNSQHEMAKNLAQNVEIDRNQNIHRTTDKSPSKKFNFGFDFQNDIKLEVGTTRNILKNDVGTIDSKTSESSSEFSSSGEKEMKESQSVGWITTFEPSVRESSCLSAARHSVGIRSCRRVTSL
jgi:outer membrane receptor for ferrienterochelin and colicin